MVLKNIAMGKTLQVIVQRDTLRYSLVSKVEKAEPARVCITAIAAGGRIFHFLPTDQVTLVYRDENQIWQWTNVHPGLAKLDGEIVHYFDVFDQGEEFNRRKSFRVEIDQDVKIGFYKTAGSFQKSAYPPLIEEEADENAPEADDLTYTYKEKIVSGVKKNVKYVLIPLDSAKPEEERGMIKDLSEVGLGIFTNFELKLDDSFFTSIESNYGTIDVKAKVVRSANSESPKYSFYYGCEFIQSDSRILKYLFDLQRQMIKKRREAEAAEKNYEKIRRERMAGKDGNARDGESADLRDVDEIGYNEKAKKGGRRKFFNR
ncbi:MAG: PilZ domain-containing protein [Lachnospiraceae bacterium]|jgi:c-di-GMP-binding flagellar brake protein YcgR|nr:PilZ domain-containing protein [Lachnospiraceae bacterium]MEE3460493.1 PilZ domain-containing protein [Lachnospiraceae bacterium]